MLLLVFDALALYTQALRSDAGGFFATSCRLGRMGRSFPESEGSPSGPGSGCYTHSAAATPLDRGGRRWHSLARGWPEPSSRRRIERLQPASGREILASSAGPYDEVQATAYLKWDRTCGCAVFCVQPVLRGRPFTASRRFAISEARKTAAGIGSAIGPIRPGYQTWPFALRQR